MKTNIIKTAIVALMALPVFTSCELDQFPTTGIVDEDVWNSPDDPQKFELGLIAQFRSIASLGDYMKDVQADYYQPNVGYGNRYGQTYRWTFGSSDTDDQTGYWASMYSVISQVNYFLANIGTETVTTEKDSYGNDVLVVSVELNPRLNITDERDKAIIEHYIGEAHFLRAYCYFGLAQRYCQDFDPATAEAELGLPIVTKVDVDGRPARATLKETTDFIEAEIAKANVLFQFDNQADLDSWASSSDEDNQRLYKAFRFSFSRHVLNAFEARYSLWAHNYDRALDLADELINSGYFDLATSADEFAEMWKYDKGSEFIFVPVENSDERTSYSVYHGYNATYSNKYSSYGSWYAPDYLPSAALINSYSSTDIRADIFFEAVDVVFGSSNSMYYDMGGLKLLNKFPGNPDLCKEADDPAHSYLNAPKPFRIAEQYMIAAEASYRLGNEGDARDYLNMLRSNRGLADTSNSGDALFKDIQDEWYREFVGEGFRLDCLKRWHLGFTRDGDYQRTSSSNGPVVATNVQELTLEVSPDDKRFVWEIPTNDIETNPNLGGANWH